MTIKKFERIRVEDEDANRIQDKIEKFSRQFPNKEIIDGLLIKDISLTVGLVNEIDHKLGRELIGYIVVGKSAAAIISDDQANNTRKDKTLKLNTSALATVNLWVF